VKQVIDNLVAVHFPLQHLHAAPQVVLVGLLALKLRLD